MFWRGKEETPQRARKARPRGPIRVEPDAPRPATILRVAGEIEERGGEILELFKEVESPVGRAVMPIHLLKDGEAFFVEVATGPWDGRAAREVADRVAVLRFSEHAETPVEILSAYPVPDELAFLCGRTPSALMQIDLLRVRMDRPEEAAGLFRRAASRHWGVDLDLDPGNLPLVEELLTAMVTDGEAGGRTPLTEGLVGGVGCFLGEVVRKNTGPGAAWRPRQSWGEGPVVEARGFELDPIGKARAFLTTGDEESLAFYVSYALEVLERRPGPG